MGVWSLTVKESSTWTLEYCVDLMQRTVKQVVTWLNKSMSHLSGVCWAHTLSFPDIRISGVSTVCRSYVLNRSFLFTTMHWLIFHSTNWDVISWEIWDINCTNELNEVATYRFWNWMNWDIFVGKKLNKLQFLVHKPTLTSCYVNELEHIWFHFFLAILTFSSEMHDIN